MDGETEVQRGQGHPASKWHCLVKCMAPGCSMTGVTSSHKASGTIGVSSQTFKPVGKAGSIQLSFSGTGQHGTLPHASHQHLLSRKKGSLEASVRHALRRQQEKEVHVGRPRHWGLEPGKVSPSVSGRAWHCCCYTQNLGGKWKVWVGASNGRKWSTPPDAFPGKRFNERTARECGQD